MHLVIGANGDTLLASPAPVPKLLLTTHDLPECPLPKTPSFYELFLSPIQDLDGLFLIW